MYCEENQYIFFTMRLTIVLWVDIKRSAPQTYIRNPGGGLHTVNHFPKMVIILHNRGRVWGRSFCAVPPLQKNENTSSSISFAIGVQ